jgi:N-acetylglucosamine malate deacetylase 1
VVTGCDVLALGAHPDDVELGCGGTVARLAAAGLRVGILDLTAGELGTRGTVEQRHREAVQAAQTLGAHWRDCLQLPDGGLQGTGQQQLDTVVRALREAAPRFLLAPHPDDPHPDHSAASTLIRHAIFLAGVAKFAPGTSPALRPRLLLFYPGPRQLVCPTIAVDVGRWYEAKRRALAAHASQFEPGAGPATHLASGHFLAAIEGRDRAAGNTVGCELAEGFVIAGPILADDLALLLGGGG